MRRALIVAGLALLACVPAAQAQGAPPGCVENRPAVAGLAIQPGTTGRPMTIGTTGGLPGCDAPGDPIAVTITWGDGATSAATVTPAGDRWRITASHRYRSPGAYRVSMQWHNGRLQLTRADLLFEARIRPAGTQVVHPKLRWHVGTRFSGEVVRFSTSGVGPIFARYRARIDWGDRRYGTGRVRFDRDAIVVTARHTWRRAPRHKRVVVQLMDERTGDILTLRRALRIRSR